MSAETLQNVLVVDDDAGILCAIATALEAPGRHVITCRDLESAELVLEASPVSLLVSDVRLTGPFRFEGLDLIEMARRQAHAPKIALMSGNIPPELEEEAARLGAVALLRKPFAIGELEALLAPPTPNGDEPLVTDVPTLDDIVCGSMLSSRFQPIIQLAGGVPVGFEALTRLQTSSLLRNPELLFRYAALRGRVADLELACAVTAIRSGAELARRTTLFLNTHPSVFASKRFAPTLRGTASAVGVPLDHIVIEITEQAPLPSHDVVADTVADLRSSGVRFAFDDVGSGYSHLASVADVRPDFLKISQSFGSSIETNGGAQNIVRSIQGLASGMGASVVLEGIETAATAAFALDHGIALGQGYHFAVPATASTCAALMG